MSSRPKVIPFGPDKAELGIMIETPAAVVHERLSWRVLVGVFSVGTNVPDAVHAGLLTGKGYAVPGQVFRSRTIPVGAPAYALNMAADARARGRASGSGSAGSWGRTRS